MTLPLPIWTLRPFEPSVIQVIVDHKAKESAQCARGDNWPEAISFWWCVFWAYVTPEQVTAVFTIVLGLSTIGLWIATKRLSAFAAQQANDMKTSLEIAKESADAAALSAKAAIGVELPVIRADGPELLDLDKPMPESGPYAGAHVELIPGKYSAVPDIEFRNEGRTQAFLLRVRIGWEVNERLPRVPEFRMAKEFGPGESIFSQSTIRIDCPYHTIQMDQDQINSLIEKRRRFWFFVSIEYEDFIGVKHDARFCWRWGCPDGVGVHFFFNDADVPRSYFQKT